MNEFHSRISNLWPSWDDPFFRNYPFRWRRSALPSTFSREIFLCCGFIFERWAFNDPFCVRRSSSATRVWFVSIKLPSLIRFEFAFISRTPSAELPEGETHDAATAKLYAGSFFNRLESLISTLEFFFSVVAIVKFCANQSFN